MATFFDTFRSGGTGKGGYTFASRNTSEVPLILQLITGQIANAIEIKNALGATIFYVSPVGNVVYTGSETVTDALTATGAITGGSLSISGLSTLSGSLIVSNGSTLSGGLTVTGNSSFGDETEIHTLTVQGEVKLESGYIRTKYSANLHLLPSPSTITIIGDAGTTSHSLDTNDDLFVTGELEVDGVLFPDGGISSSAAIHVNDDVAVSFGNTLAAPNTSILWETADANANALIIAMPEGGATDVPVAIFGDSTLLNKDLGLFDGVTNPTIAVVDGGATTALSIQYDRIAFGGLTTSDTYLINDKTNAQFGLLLGSNSGGQFILGNAAYAGKDYDHPTQSQPTFYVNSIGNPDTESRQWVKWYNDGSNSYHLTGIGGHRFGFESIAAKGVMVFTTNPTTNNGVVFTVNTGTLTGVTGAPGANQFQFGATLSVTLDNLVTAYNLIAGTNVVAHKVDNTVIFESTNTGTTPNAYVTTETTDTDGVYSFQKVLVFTANPTSTGTAQPVIFTVGLGGVTYTLTGVWTAPGANQFLIGATLQETLQNLCGAWNGLLNGSTAYYDITTLTVYFDAGSTGLNVFTETVDTDNVYSFTGSTLWGGRAMSAIMDLQPTYMKLTKQGTATVGTTTYSSQYLGLIASAWNTTTSRGDDVEFRMQATGTSGATTSGNWELSRWKNGVLTGAGAKLDSNGSFYSNYIIGANYGKMQFGQQNAGTGDGTQMWFIGLENVGTGNGTQFVGYLNYDLKNAATSIAHVFDTYISQTTAGAKLISIRNKTVEKVYIDYLGSVNAGSGTALLPAYSFVGDPNTGIWNSAADQLGFVSGGTDKLTLTSLILAPTSNDGLALGNGTTMWSDLFLASSGVINFNNGNYTITHSAGLLTTNGALTISGALGGATNIAMNGTITGVTTAITGTQNTALNISIPDQGTADANGVGITIEADDGGSGGAGVHNGGMITLKTGAGQGVGGLNGAVVLTTGGTNWGQAMPGGATRQSLVLGGNAANSGGATNPAMILGALNNLISTGDVLLSVRTNILSSGGTEKFYIDKDGSYLGQGRRLEIQGADVASANDMTLGLGNYFDITGAVQMNTVVSTGWTAGTMIVLQFDANPLVKHATAGAGAQFQLAGSVDFSATAGDTLSLVFDGTYWREICRTAI